MSARATCNCGWTGTYRTPARAEAMAAKHLCKKDDAVRRATRRHRCARCGLEAVYENAGATEARYWFSRHSCRKRELALLRATQAEQRDALIDRTPKQCLHKVADHQCGTRTKYVLDRCRCAPCSKANSQAETQRERLKAYGRYNKYVPALAVREHVNALTAAGMGLKQVAKVSGVAHGALWKLMYGKTQPDGTRIPSRRVLRETAEKLYAIDAAWTGLLELAPGALDRAGTPEARARLRSLVALGWSMSELGRRLGIAWERNAILIVKDDQRVMQRRTVDAANALFEQLCMTPAPETCHRERISAARARNYAKAHGWLPPLDLDDEAPDSTDSATSTPALSVVEDIDDVAIQRRMAGDRSVRLNKIEATELVRRWKASGQPLNECTRITGLKPERYYLDTQEATA